MEAFAHSDHKVINREHRLRAALLSRHDLARLRSECDSLLSMADRLEALSADVHTNRRAEEAQFLVGRLRLGLPAHLEKEVAVMAAVEKVDDASLIEAMDRARAEHAAMGELIVPVIRGLRAIGKDRLPTRLSSFVLATSVFCEFIRMHAQFKRERLYPLLARRQAH